ncbi:MAG: two-component regulator propeller domain-containing protein, partial [Rhodanobacter sp.]
MPRPVSPSTPGLFAEPDALKPLAERMRPRSLDEIVGQQRLVGPDKALRRALEAGKIHSMVLWGPPGCGKTTLALLVARYADADFRAISAVLSGLPDAYVRSLLALPDGSLLIGTNAGGLVRFEPADNSFHVYPVGADGLSDRKVFALGDDHAGGVWIATEEGLDHLDLRTGSIRRVDTGADAAPRNFSVMQDRHGNLWLGNNGGLFVRRAGTDAFVRPAAPDKLAATVLDNQIWAIMQDREGRLWAGSGQAGAAYRDTDGRWHGVPGFSGYPDSA